MSRAKKKLDESAVKKANEAFYANHETLRGKQLSGTDPKQAALRKEWMSYYKTHERINKFLHDVADAQKKIQTNEEIKKLTQGVYDSWKRIEETKTKCPKPGSKIILEGTKEEKEKLEAILDRIRKTKSGRKLLTDIDNAKNPVTFKLGDAKSSGGGFSTLCRPEAFNGTGCANNTITLDKDLKDDAVYVYDKKGNKISEPVDVIAAHELTHALHCANGTDAGETDDSKAEAQAINSENAIRRERKPKLTERDPNNHVGGYN